MIRRGSYALFMVFRKDMNITAGALGEITVGKGEYCYIGSAKNGLDQRLRRHFSKEKKIHWHIDNLTIVADSMEAFDTGSAEECDLRIKAEDSGMTPFAKGFGCSDCGCDTHLLVSDPRSKEHFIRTCGLTGFRVP